MKLSALILAAGRGSRMGSMTQEAPKCLVPLAGKTLLEWQLAALRKTGIQEIGVVCGYMREKLQRFGLHSFENSNWASSNMVSSLRCAHEWLNARECLVSYSDIVYPASTVAALAESPHDIAITYDRDWLKLWQLRFADPLSDAETFQLSDRGELRSIGAKTQSLSDIQGQYMGLLKFRPAGWQRVSTTLAKLAPEAVAKLDMTSLLQRLLSEGVTIGTVPVNGQWYEVDSESDLSLYERQIARRESWLQP